MNFRPQLWPSGNKNSFFCTSVFKSLRIFAPNQDFSSVSVLFFLFFFSLFFSSGTMIGRDKPLYLT